MNYFKMIMISALTLSIVGCSVKTAINNQYQLSAFSCKKVASKPHDITLLVTAPDATAAFQTEQMLYVKKPFQIEPFAKNVWVSPPGDMLHPLLMQSLQATGYFDAVISSAYTQGTDYRLDTQLLSLKQNFMKKPSVIEFSAKVVLTRVKDNEALGSEIIAMEVPCTADTPYGGVVAANSATYQFTEKVTRFVLGRIK